MTKILAKFSQLILISTLFSSFTVKAEIIETNNFAVIKDKFLELQKTYDPKKLLGVIAIKNVILTTPEPALNQTNPNFPALLKKITTQLKPVNSIYLETVILTNYKQQLVEANIANFITEITAQNTPIIAISSNLTGNFNNIKRLEVWLAERLKEFDLDFSGSFPDHNDLTFNNMEKFQGSSPVFYNGILNCNDQRFKLAAFTNLLLQLKFSPHVIVMVDADLNSLNNMEIQLQHFDNNIKFIAYHYTAANLTQKEISEQELIKFWHDLIDKVNKVKRITTKPTEEATPYEE